MTALDHPLSPEELMAYLDGELQADRATVVQAHVAGCDVCQRLSGELRGLSRGLARWQVEDAPASLRAPRAALPADTGSASLWSRLRWPLSLKHTLAAASIVGTVAIVLGPLFLQRDAPKLARPMAYEVALGPAAPAPKAPARTAERASIARTARLRVRTTDFDAARPIVDRLVTDIGGLVGSLTVSGTRGEARSLTATLLIPSNRLNDALTTLRTVGVVMEETQGGEDVTEQVVDVEARLSNARSTEKRLVDLLQKRTGNLADVLAAEREIARVREEIERFDAERQRLDRRVTYATVNLEIREERQAQIDLGPQSVSAMFREALVGGLTTALDSALGFGLLVLRAGPVLLLWLTVLAALAWPARAIARRLARQ